MNKLLEALQKERLTWLGQGHALEGGVGMLAHALGAVVKLLG